MQLYLDMDGVLMDFERHVSGWLKPWQGRIYIHLPEREWTPEEKANDKLYKEAMVDQNFWSTMPPMSDSALLWDFCQPFKPHVLTATPNNAHYRERCAVDKWRSIRGNFDPKFPENRFHACLRSEKRGFCKPGDVLVDDMTSNCEEWIAAGGQAVLHKDALSTTKILQELGFHGR